MWGWVTGSTSSGAASDEAAKEQGAKPQAALVVVPGLPAPKSDMEFLMAASELMEDVRKYGEQANTPEVGWTPVGHSTERVELFERKIPKLEATALTLMKAVGEVEGATPQDILEFTLEGDLNKRKEFDPDISLLEVLKDVTPTIQVTRTHFVAPFPVYPREFVDMRTWVEGDDRILFGAQSVNFDGAPFSTEHVRGSSWNGIIMEKVEGRDATRIVFMGYVDPQGWVPHAVIAVLRAKITERIDVLRKVVARKKAAAVKK